MITIQTGNIFESQAQTLVNPINCVGVMGKGLALEFKKRFPDMFEDYAKSCQTKKVHLGEPYLYRRRQSPWILNFPTKDHWRSVSHLSDIVRGLEYLEKHYCEWKITSLAVPALGCQNGQLDWRTVGPTLSRQLSRLSIPVELYAPLGTPPVERDASLFAQDTSLTACSEISHQPGKIDPAAVGLVEILARVEREPYHWPVERITFQKMAYFATALGMPTGLQFARGSSGPFSGELHPLVTQLVNNGLIQEEQLGRTFTIKLGPTYHDAVKAYRPQLAQWDSVMDRVADLFMRLQSKQADMAATIYFTAQTLARETGGTLSERAILQQIKQWEQKRCPPFKEEEIAETIRELNILGWLNAQPSLDAPFLFHDDF